MAGGQAITSGTGIIIAEGGAGSVATAISGSEGTSAGGLSASAFLVPLRSRKVGAGTATVGLGQSTIYPGIGTLTVQLDQVVELFGEEVTGLTGTALAMLAGFLTWNANTEPDMQLTPATYRVYHALEVPNWDSVVDVGLVTTYQPGLLNPAYTHYFAVSAKDTSGNESNLKSNIVNTLPVMGFATMTWNANTDPDLAGYRLYHGLAPNDLPDVVPLGLVTTYQWTGLTPVGVTHYFKLSAIDSSGNESINNPTGSKAL